MEMGFYVEVNKTYTYCLNLKNVLLLNRAATFFFFILKSKEVNMVDSLKCFNVLMIDF